MATAFRTVTVWGCEYTLQVKIPTTKKIKLVHVRQIFWFSFVLINICVKLYWQENILHFS